MEKYDNLGLVGEGSYGIVMKCRHKATGTLVAIKKFLESEDDKIVKRIAHREIKMLKQLRHENLVSLIDVFKRRKKLYLVFEFVDYTLLDDLEKNPTGLDDKYAKKVLFQVLRGIEFCHNNNVIHRDIKPENILVGKSGVVKLCDFGFARPIAGEARSFTDYVATRWYRAPELLVGDTRYGKPVDVWAIGCLTSEMYTGDPLFPGDSDIDQLFHIVRCIGSICAKHVEIFRSNHLFKGLQLPHANSKNSIDKRYPKLPKDIVEFIVRSLDPVPEQRPSCTELIKSNLFCARFAESLISEIKLKVQKDQERNPLLKTLLTHSSQPHSKFDPYSNNDRQTVKPHKQSVPLSLPNQKPNVQGNVHYRLKENFALQQAAISNPQQQHQSTEKPTANEEETGAANSPEKSQVTVDEDEWADVRPLTSRKERVASRAGRMSKKQTDKETAANIQQSGMDSSTTSLNQQHPDTNNNSKHSQRNISDSQPTSLSKDPYIQLLNQDLITKPIKPITTAFTQVVTTKSTVDSNSTPVPDLLSRSSPIPNELSLSQSTYNFSLFHNQQSANSSSSTAVKKMAAHTTTTSQTNVTNTNTNTNTYTTAISTPTVTSAAAVSHDNSTNVNALSTNLSSLLKTSNTLSNNTNVTNTTATISSSIINNSPSTISTPITLYSQTLHSHNISSNNFQYKQLGQKSLADPISTTHNYLPNINNRDVIGRIRLPNFGFPTVPNTKPGGAVSGGTANFSNSNNNSIAVGTGISVNSGISSTTHHKSNNTFMMGDRSGIYFKKKPTINSRFNMMSHNPGYDSNISLPELKGAPVEMQIIRGYGPYGINKFKHSTHNKPNFNSNDSQSSNMKHVS